MPTRKAPSNCYWRGHVLWGRIQVKGTEIKWSLRTGDAAIAKRRVKDRRDREIAVAHFGDDRKSYDDTFTRWSGHIISQVSPTTAERYACSLSQLAPWLRPLFVDEINKAMVNQIVDARRTAGVSIATIRRDLTALSSVLDYAEHRDWREGNPALPALRRLKERREPIVLPDHGHITRVAARAPGMLSVLTLAALRTGCRQDELVRAERNNLDRQRRQLTVLGKGNRPRVIELDEDTFESLRALPAAIGCRWLFWHGDGEPYRNVSSRFAAIVKAEYRAAQKAAQAVGNDKDPGFRPFRFHDLRHRHAVDWLKSGRSIYDLKERLGHRSIKTTEIYLAFLTPEEARTVKQTPAQLSAHVQRSKQQESA